MRSTTYLFQSKTTASDHWLARQQLTLAFSHILDNVTVGYDAGLMRFVLARHENNPETSTHILHICLNQEVTHTVRNQMLMLARKLLNANELSNTHMCLYFSSFQLLINWEALKWQQLVRSPSLYKMDLEHSSITISQHSSLSTWAWGKGPACEWSMMSQCHPAALKWNVHFK